MKRRETRAKLESEPAGVYSTTFERISLDNSARPTGAMVEYGVVEAGPLIERGDRRLVVDKKSRMRIT